MLVTRERIWWLVTTCTQSQSIFLDPPKNSAFMTHVSSIEDYELEDMILARFHDLKDSYTEQFKHLPKYYVKATSKQHYKGEGQDAGKRGQVCPPQAGMARLRLP